MGERGPAPEPTELRILRGNPSGRPLPAKEPRPKPAKPLAPSHLDAIAKAEWRRVLKVLYPLGLITKADRSTLAAYCEAYSTWVRACKELEADHAEVMEVGKDGYQQVSPWYTIKVKEAERMAKLAAQFGMSPSARTRIQADPVEEEADRLGDFLKRGKK